MNSQIAAVLAQPVDNEPNAPIEVEFRVSLRKAIQAKDAAAQAIKQTDAAIRRGDAAEPGIFDSQLLAQHRHFGIKPLVLRSEAHPCNRAVDAP